MLIPEQSTQKRKRNRKKIVTEGIGVSSDTFVLTEQGWKQFKDVQETDILLVLDPIKMELDYAPISRLAKSMYDGDILHYETSRIDARMTLNVPLIALNRRAGDGVGLLKSLRTSGTVNKRTLVPYKSFSYVGGSDTEKIAFSIPEFSYVKEETGETIVMEKFSVSYNSWLEFMGFWVSGIRVNGHLPTDGSILFLHTNEEKQYVAELFKRMGILDVFHSSRISVREKDGSTIVYSRQIYDYLYKQFYSNGKKRIPRWILNLKKGYLQWFMKGLLYGCGHVEELMNEMTRITFTSVSEDYLYDISELVLKVYGTIPRILPITNFPYGKDKIEYSYYRVNVTVNHNNKYITYGVPKQEPYVGEICHVFFDSDRYLYYLARREKKSFWIGGSLKKSLEPDDFS